MLRFVFFPSLAAIARWLAWLMMAVGSAVFFGQAWCLLFVPVGLELTYRLTVRPTPVVVVERRR